MRLLNTFAGFLLVLSNLASPREIFVDPAGADAASGDADHPIRTIGQAARIAAPGDVCIMGAGVYRETVRPATSGTTAAPIRFVSLEPGAVVVSGADVLAGAWEEDGDGVWSTPCGEPIDQVFVDGVMMVEARWPNTVPGNMLEAPRAAAGPGTGYDGLADPALPAGDWSGARVRLWPGDRWTNATRRVLDYEAGKGFRFDRDFRPTSVDVYHQHDPFLPRPGNPYVLFGVLAALDAPGEWVFDAGAGRLRLIPPANTTLKRSTVEVKRRLLAWDLEGLSHIAIEGIDSFAGAVSLKGATSCRLQGCQILYPDHFRDSDKYQVPSPGNVVSGSDNELNRCRIAYAAGTGLQIKGKGNRLINAIVQDTNLTGSNAAAVCINDSEDTIIRQCSIFRSGRGLVRHYRAKRVRIELNDLHHANMLTSDAGATYAWGTDGEGSVLAYNWVHDNTGDHTMGIYLDNFCSHFIVHHNVVWSQTSTGIRLNSDATDHLVANNTVIQATPFGVFTYAGRTPTQKGTRIINNLVIGRLAPTDPHQFVQGDLAPFLACNLTGAIDARGVPTVDSAAVDAGIVEAGITDGFIGAAPDVGAYERGGDVWQPGADWGDVASHPDLRFRPLPAVDASHMIRQGLVLWLDAGNLDPLQAHSGGRLKLWRDASGHDHDATVGAGFVVVGKAMNGLPVVRASGEGCLAIGHIRGGTGPLTLFIVVAGPQGVGEAWQRLAGSWSGHGEEWVAPNWTIVRPGGEKPAAFPPQVFLKTESAGLVLEHVTVGGSSCGARQYFTGDIAEVLLYDRVLRFDELAAVESYLKKKWDLP